jgi:hypothetical protein
MEDNKKSLFSNKEKKDDVDLTTITSQSQGFNIENYVKKWEIFWNTTSTDVSYSNNWKLGDTVKIVEGHEEFSGKKGKITLGFSKEPDMLCIKFKDGKKEMIEKEYVSKISIYDYLQDNYLDGK